MLRRDGKQLEFMSESATVLSHIARLLYYYYYYYYCYYYYYYYYYYNHFTTLWNLSGTTRVSWSQKKHSPTHTYSGHQSSLICFLHLLRPIVQFTCLAVFFHNLSKFSLVCLLVWH